MRCDGEMMGVVVQEARGGCGGGMMGGCVVGCREMRGWDVGVQGA